MPSSDTLDQMFVVGLVAHLIGWVASAILSVTEKDDSAKRLTAVWSFLGQYALFMAYIFLLIDAGLYTRDDGELFSQPFFIAITVWALFSIISAANIERLSKANGLLVVLFFTTSCAMLFLAGRENQKKSRDAMYIMAWLPLAFSVVYLFVASRLRRMLWVDYKGSRSSEKLPYTPLERTIQHASSAGVVVIPFVVGVTLGLSPCIGHRISVSQQYIGYLIASLLTLVVSTLQYMGTREINSSPKTD